MLRKDLTVKVKKTTLSIVSLIQLLMFLFFSEICSISCVKVFKL